MICPKCLPKGCVLQSDCGCNCHNTHVHPEFSRFKTYDELVKFQIRINRDYTYYPAKPDEWIKLSPERITVKGLKELSKINRLIVWGKATHAQYYIYRNLLLHFAESNPTDKRLRDFSKVSHHDFYGNEKPFFPPMNKNFKIPFEWDMKKQGLVEDNPQYDKIFAEKNNQWGFDLILECYRLRKLEGLS